jgi:acyl-coenzyme A thioesterase PaaI-like protein
MSAILNKEEEKMALDDKLILRPSITEYFRIDEELLANNPHFVEGNAFHDTLRGNREVLLYEVYQKREGNELACVIMIGDKLNGHPGIVHGGILSTAFDNSFGWLFLTMGIPPAFTANLNVNFRRPVLENSAAILRAKVSEIKVCFTTSHTLTLY